MTYNRKMSIAALMLFCASCGGGSGDSLSSADQEALARRVKLVAAPSQTPSPSPTATSTPLPVTVSAAGYVLSPTLNGASDLLASFDIASGLQAAWGTGGIPDLYTADRSEGAFRFTCGGDGKVAQDDPLVYPNQPGKSHLHKVWGNADFSAATTPASLAASATTNCNRTGFSLNRSSYWMPALLDDLGNVMQPNLVSVYYKRGTASSAYCDPNSAKFVGTCVSLPNQIRYVFGWNMDNPTAKVEGASWYCTGGTGGHFPNLNAVFASGCRTGDILVANTVAPNCWDGKYLDTPDHRSHMAYADYSRGDGMAHCPASHPFYIPQEENKAMWTVTAAMIRADGTSRVRLSSDDMLPGAQPGETLHADYIESWVAGAKTMWMDNCINKGLSCSGGDLGNGKQLIGAT